MAESLIKKNSVDSVELTYVTSLSDLETKLNRMLSDMDIYEMKTVSFAVSSSFAIFDTTLYVGSVYKMTETRAWVLLNTAFNYLTVGTKNNSWGWKRISMS